MARPTAAACPAPPCTVHYITVQYSKVQYTTAPVLVLVLALAAGPAAVLALLVHHAVAVVGAVGVQGGAAPLYDALQHPDIGLIYVQILRLPHSRR